MNLSQIWEASWPAWSSRIPRWKYHDVVSENILFRLRSHCVPNKRHCYFRSNKIKNSNHQMHRKLP